jgi:hypothetical protein
MRSCARWRIDGPARRRHRAVVPKFIIERTLPGASQLPLAAVAAKSNAVIRELGPDLQWVQSYVAGDKIYCVYNAASAELLHEHARKGGFPIDAVHLVVTTIDPTTAEPR